jgi:hypothetical protein
MPKPSADTLIMYCGTKPFNKFMAKTMTELGYSEDMLIKFWSCFQYDISFIQIKFTQM